MNISIFAKPPFMGTRLQRVSSIIRGEQIAAYMQGVRLNPEDGYEKDICIYVKPYIKLGENFNFEGHSYLDILDGFALWRVLINYEHVPVIVFSQLDVETMARFVKNKIILIPHHHVNFERVKREGDKVTRVGVIGSPSVFGFIPDEIRHGIANRNMELVEYSTFYPRMSVVNFYKNIDVQLVWRPYKIYLSNPFKIVNTSSFGIPTIALDEPSFKEMEGCYIPVKTPGEFLIQLDVLRSSRSLYTDISKTCLMKSEKYHISNIAKLYRNLCQTI